MIFPVWRFWTFTPWGWLAAILWNATELLGVRCPFAPTMFGLIIGSKGIARKGSVTKEGE